MYSAAAAGPPQHVIRVLMGFVPGRAIYAAAKLGIADQIDQAGSTPKELAAQLGLEASALERLLGTLTSLGLLHGDDKGDLSSHRRARRCAVTPQDQYVITPFLFTNFCILCSSFLRNQRFQCWRLQQLERLSPPTRA